jgi:uncharacterized membrane protein HdeD (DUF308 family)
VRFVVAAKAAVSLAAGLAITFSQSHHSAVGLWVLGIFGLAYAAVVTALSLKFEASRFVVDELALVVLAGTIGVFSLLNIEAGDAAFVSLVAIWALVTAGYELLIALRSRPSGLKNRDHLISAGLALVLGVLFLLAPLDIVSAVGFFGAYLVLSSVHLGIAAFSPKA